MVWNGSNIWANCKEISTRPVYFYNPFILLLILIVDSYLQTSESTAVYSYIHLIYRAACDWGIWDNWSNLVGTPWTESKMVTAGRNQDRQKALTDCTENCTRTLCGRKCDFFMGAGCKSHIPHKTSLQTTEGLGLEKYLFVNYTDIKKKKKHYIMTVELVYKVSILYSLYCILPLYYPHDMSMIS